MCVCVCVCVFVNLRGGVVNTSLCNLFGLRGLLQSVIWDLGSSRSLMLFWGFMWSKIIEKKRKANGVKKEKSERFDLLKTSSLSLLVIAGI